MKVLNIADTGEVQLEWNSRYGPHSYNATADIPPDIKAHVDALVAWAVAAGNARRAANELYESEREIDREIAKLEVIRADIRARR